MPEKNISFWDLLLKLFTPLIAAITIFIGIYQYKVNGERDFRKDLFNRQLDVYLESSQVVAELSNCEKNQIGSKVYEKARGKFFNLKYGRLYFLEDTIVEPHFVKFTEALLRFERNDPLVSNEDLQFLALELNASFRKSIQATWGIDNKFLNPKHDDVIK